MDWAPGDLALCVKVYENDHKFGPGSRLRLGGVYRVFRVQDAFDIFGRKRTALALEGVPTLHPNGVGHNAEQFRKIAPHEPDAEDAETIYQLVYAPSPVFTNQIGGTAPVAAPSPEAANNGSGRGAGICLGAPALSQLLDNARGRLANRDALTAPLSMPFHDQPDNAEARDNHGA